MISNMKKALVILLLLFPLCGLARSQQNIWGTACDDDGFHLDLSNDNTEIVINDNQIVISIRTVKVSSDDIDIFFYKTLDLGRGGMNLPWKDFDKTKKIAEMKLINGKGYLKWLGFFNKKENKYDWVKDPDFVQSFSRSGLIEMKSCN